MKTKNILFLILCFCLMISFCSCEQDDDFNLGDMQVGFVKAGIDVGENAGKLQIPLLVEGIPESAVIDLSAEIQAKDGTAKNNIDYKFTTQTVKIDRAGQYLIEVEILNNETIEAKNKSFTLNLSQVTAGVTKKITEIEINIIDEDLPAITIAGNYTLMASDFVRGGDPWSGEKGKVTVEEDPSTPGKYWMRDLELVSDDGILFLTMEDGLYFILDEEGHASIPFMQNVGDYGNGDGVIVGLEGEEGLISEADIPLTINSSSIYFNIDGIAAIVASDEGIESIYYALRNVILKKTK